MRADNPYNVALQNAESGLAAEVGVRVSAGVPREHFDAQGRELLEIPRRRRSFPLHGYLPTRIVAICNDMVLRPIRAVKLLADPVGSLGVCLGAEEGRAIP